MVPRVPITYTFGNHMHWVDMEWLWGYHVLPGSVRDMLAFCQQTGARGNVNFDAVGYERLAAEDPEALDSLRRAVRLGIVEVVGASYGQPYGGLHGGESNVRQRVYGVRSVMRTLGVRPRTFWEEEFDCFPQLPQLLARCGFEHASLFFQWTWHTPEVPKEPVPVIWWESPDGSRLLTATRNDLNLHQWPEDIQLLMDQLAATPATDAENSLILQWLELMPSPDWMCRSEVLLPKTKALLSDPRFDVTFATLGGYLASIAETETIPARRYSPDEVFHGLTLGKNGDGFRRLSRRAEHQLLDAESLAAIAGLFGRPYAQWDVYPTWELEEGWRELLQAQHHDNDECEGLCGHVGQFSYVRSLSLSNHVRERTAATLTRQIDAPQGFLVAFNPLGWSTSAVVPHPVTGEAIEVRNVPALGWRAIPIFDAQREACQWKLGPDKAIGRCRGLEVEIDRTGAIVQITTPEWPEGVLDDAIPLLNFSAVESRVTVEYMLESIELDPVSKDLVVRYRHPVSGGLRADIRLVAHPPAVDVTIIAGHIPRPDPGLNAGLRTRFGIRGGIGQLITDSPYMVHTIEGRGTFRRKYPTGDWMTSPQWFETVTDPFHSLSLVDLVSKDGQSGLLIVHDGSPQWFRVDDGVENALNCYDPWDEAYWVAPFRVAYRLFPHAGLSHRERYRHAQSFLRPPVVTSKSNDSGTLPATFSALNQEGSGTVTAFYRETRDRGQDLTDYAANDFPADYPTIIRVVEFDGVPGVSQLTIHGTIASAVRTDLMGERGTAITAQNGQLHLPVGAHEVNTVYVDIVEARKRPRDLDAHREVWATVHRQD